ncbi:hypothetical protein JXA05_02245 [Candidatus Peregrinibacteria bacterium]|nr:hypothetical protein [Candidatus Peregrinibacteria bacterium]
MKIAIAALKNNPDSQVSEVAGRAPFYLFFDGGKLVEAVKNPFCVGAGGAGFAVAEMLGDKKVDFVVAGRFGEKMHSALEGKGVKCRELSGMTAKEALNQFLN